MTGTLENRILDLEKIKFLNTTKEREKLDLDPRYGKWYQKLVRDIKTSERVVKESVQREHDKVRIQEIEEEIA